MIMPVFFTTEACLFQVVTTCLYSPALKVHSTKTSGPLRFSELGKQRASKNSVYLTREACSKIIIFTVLVRSLEKKLEDLAGLSPNYWLTKFVQEIANKNEIVNSAHRMFTELKKNELAV